MGRSSPVMSSKRIAMTDLVIVGSGFYGLTVAQQGAEKRTIFKEAFAKYTINQSKMLRYADRRRKKEELNLFVKTFSNLWQQ
jgi:hypothetical protein